MKIWEIIFEAAGQDKRPSRTPHPEDAIFLGGIAAAKKALEELAWTSRHADAVTVKWDGYPALIFGRMPDGRLSITDKYMWDAKFPAYSTEDWVAYDKQKAHGGQRPDLYRKLQILYPALDAAVRAPGFYWGDLMWLGQLKPQNNKYNFKAQEVAYHVDPASALGQLIPGKIGGIVVHQKFANFGDTRSGRWDGRGLANVNGGVALFPPNIGNRFNLKPVNVTPAQDLINHYGAAVENMLSQLPKDARQKLQTYYNQRIIGQAQGSLVDYVKQRMSGTTQKKLLGQTTDQGHSPGLLGTIREDGKFAPSAAYIGLDKIWTAIYNIKQSLVQQLNPQIKGIDQEIAGQPEGEGFVVSLPQTHPIKLVNRQGFSAASLAKNYS